MRKELKKTILCTSALIGLAGALGVAYHITLQKLMKVALDREEPKQIARSKKKISSSGDVSSLLSICSAAGEKLRNKVHKKITITGNDGVKLVGHWYCPENPKRVIIAMHGWRSSWCQDFGLIADFWLNNGCAVLFAEQRAQGDSGGDYMGFGLLERYDCYDWINWVNSHTNSSLPIYLGGISMGATTVLMTAGFELPKNVCGIIADCGFTSPNAIWKHVVQNNLHIPFGIYAGVAKELCRKRINMSSDEYSTTQALADSKIPILFIHGTEDNFVPINMTYENYKACGSKKHLLIVPGAGHGMSYILDKQGYEKAVAKLWAENDSMKEDTDSADN